MAGNLKMSTSDLNNAKSKIAEDNIVLGDCIQGVYNQILNLVGNSWTGEAAQEAKTQIESFYKKTYSAYLNAVNGYIEFIENTIRRYDAAEEGIKTNAKTNMDSSALADFQ